MAKQDETMNLDDLKAYLSDVSSTDEFDLESIIAEVEATAPSKPKTASAPPAAKAAPKAEAVKTAPKPAATPSPVKADPAEKKPAEPQVTNSVPEAEAAAQEARRAAKQEKTARKAEKAAEKESKRVAKLAARAAEQEEAPVREKPQAVPQAKAPKMTKKEARAARVAAEQAEEEAEITLRDPIQAQRSFQRRARSLSVRSVVVLLLAVAATYISLAPTIEALPLPNMIDALENPGLGIGALMIIQFVALFVGIDVFGMGFVNLFTGTPDRNTLVSVSVVAALLHAASIIIFDNNVGVTIPYLAVSTLMLYAAMREERNRFSARARAYKAVASAEQPMSVYSHYDRQDDACRAIKAPLHEMREFLLEMERPDTIDRFSMIYTPLALAASIIFALISSVGRGEPTRFFWAFSALLSISAPLGLLCAFGASYKNVSRRLLGQGAALSGARQANLLRGTEEVVLTESELFPIGSITLDALQNMGQLGDDKLLAYAAALTSEAGLELGRVLSDTLRERYGTAVNVRNLQTVEGGIAGDIGGSRVIIGTAALMVKLGMRIRAGQGVDSCNAYLVVDDTLVGILTLRYQPTKNTYHAMRTMRRMNMNAALAVRDFNISPSMVESQFDLRRGFADQPEPDSIARMLDSSYTEGDAPAAILTREGAGPFVQVLRCADKLAGAVRSNVVLGTFAGVCGMLIVFYLLFQNAVAALPVMNLLLYMLLWYVPVFLITQQTH